MNRPPAPRPVARTVARLGVAGLFALSMAACADEDVLDTPDTSGGADVGTTDVGGTDASTDVTPDATEDTGIDVPEPDPATWDDWAPAAAPVPRLTQVQLANTFDDLFGADVVVPPISLPDLEDGGFVAVGASGATLSPRTVEDMERAAREVARQVLEPERRDRFVSCTPADTVDTDCAETFVREQGLRIWRRPLTDAEVERLVAIADEAALVLEDFHAGLEWALSALLQSPHFMFRREVGDGDGERRPYDDFEMAARLSYLLWSTTPDDELLAAAEAGELTTDDGLRAQFERLLASDRARDGVLELFRQAYHLHELEDLSKDPNVYPQMHPDLGTDALEETERVLEALIFDEEADFRELLVSNRTFVNRRLAALYGIPAPSADGWGEVFLAPETGRRGLFGHVSFLAVNSHPTSTSATERGLFVREALLCMVVPPPPSGVDTSIPEPSPDAPTLRERIAVHLEDPNCAGCHLLTDPMGLSFENFDGVGVWRATENGVEIDASGELDGAAFDDAWDVADVVTERREFGRCVAQHLLRYGTATIEGNPQRPGIEVLEHAFVESEYRVLDLLEAFVMSPAFRTAGAPVVTAEEEE